MKNKVEWTAEKENPELCGKIRDSLRGVKDPEIGIDLIQLGLIRNVEIEKDKLKIEMILTTPYCPYAPMLMESARKKAEEASGIPSEIFYGKEVWDQTMMEDDTALNWGLF